MINTFTEKWGDSIFKRVLSGFLIVIIIISEFMNPMLLEAKNNYKYTKTTVNIRASPSKNGKIVGQL